MGKQERETLRTELEILGQHREENDAYYEQNRRVIEAERNVNLLENLWVRGGMA